MENKNSFHIKKMNHQEKTSWAEMMRAGYVWIAAFLCFAWYAAGKFELYQAEIALFAGVTFFAIVYLCAVQAGKGIGILVTFLYLLCPFLLLSMTNIRKALLTFCRKVADYLADYGQSKDIFHRILQNVAVDMQTGNVEFIPFIIGALGITMWLLLLMALLWKIHPCILFFAVSICFLVPFFIWGIRPELFSVLSFLIFCFFLFSPSFWGGVLGVGILILLLAGGTFLGLTNGNKFSSLQKDWNKKRYQEEQAVLPEGKLEKAKKMKRTDKDALQVTLNKKSSYYLRGFVGTDYENNSWVAGTDDWSVFGSDSSMLAASGQEAYDSLLWLHNKEFYGNTVMYHFVKQKKIEDGKAELSLYMLSVKNVGANRKYLYLPYECAVFPSVYEENGTAALNKTENLFASGIKGVQEYSFKAMGTMAGQLESSTTIKGGSKNISSQKVMESYKEYVNATCLFLNKETKTIIAAETKGNLQGNLSTLAIINRIKNWMKTSVTYNENPGEISKGEDFAKWFFEEKKSGYDVQYAAAAVMMFRYYGIPSRYVEGYLLTPETVKNAGMAEHVNISQKYAHAWPEIYIDGMGWIPVEVTPKYENVMGTPYYETQETAKSNSNATDETLQSKENQTKQSKQEKKQIRQKKKIQTIQNTPQSSFKETRGEKRLRTRFVLFPLFVVLLLLLFFFRKRIQDFFWNWKTEKLLSEKKYSQAVMFWYDILVRCLYGKEKIKDNRIRTVEKRLCITDNEINQKKLRLCMSIRQKAVYSSEEISKKEAEAAIYFLKTECKKLR